MVLSSTAVQAHSNIPRNDIKVSQQSILMQITEPKGLLYANCLTYSGTLA
jgi:hypothetical protein